MKHLIIVFLILCMVSCNHKKSTDPTYNAITKIDSIEVLFYNSLFESFLTVDCDEMVYFPEKVDTLDVILEDGSYLPKESTILKSVITDKNVLYAIEQELDSMQPLDWNYIDARMKCFIYCADNQIDTLCIHAYSNFAIYNNRYVRFSNKLLYLLRKNCGFYRWIGTDMMQYFNELNDPTFVRETITNRWGQKYKK